VASPIAPAHRFIFASRGATKISPNIYRARHRRLALAVQRINRAKRPFISKKEGTAVDVNTLTTAPRAPVAGGRLQPKAAPSAGRCRGHRATARGRRSATLPGRAAVLCLLSAALSGCTGIQSALDPRGPAANAIADLTWVMFAGAAAIFLLVVALLAYVLLRRPERRGRINSNVFIAAGGIALPVVVLSILLIYVFRIGAQLTEEPPEDRLIVEVTGHQWWWEFRYVGESPHLDVTTANELHIPVGHPVELRLKSADVIHTLWVPNLAGKRDLIPGRSNRLVLQADETGLFRGQCNEFCGAQHALMRMYVISQPAEEFERWLEAQRQPAQRPTDATLKLGETAFLSSGCPVCHTVRGIEAHGATAPDLTHFGGRRTIAAGTLKNTLGNRQAWIVSSQHLKPENNMPNYTFDGATLRALAAYLGSLE
jgi:cytochrome c oxidase subunit 2